MATRWQRLRARLTEPFRVTVQREETFEEVNAYSVNGANVLALALAAAVVCALLTFTLIAVTPLRTLLPGFGQLDERTELLALKRDLDAIEAEVSAQEAYTANVQRILVGDVDRYDEAAAAAPEPTFSDSALTVERIPEDEQLRRDVARARTRYTGGAGAGGVPLDQLQFGSPLAGAVSSAFDPTDRHFGVDVVAPAESPVKATLDGYVVEAGWSVATGNVIAVQHPGELISFYKHNSRLLKRRGEHVRRGEAIAIVGNSGTRTDGPHLHFELWHRGRPVNPVTLIDFE